jgi:hypothetical protein
MNQKLNFNKSTNLDRGQYILNELKKLLITDVSHLICQYLPNKIDGDMYTLNIFDENNKYANIEKTDVQNYKNNIYVATDKKIIVVDALSKTILRETVVCHDLNKFYGTTMRERVSCIISFAIGRDTIYVLCKNTWYNKIIIENLIGNIYTSYYIRTLTLEGRSKAIIDIKSKNTNMNLLKMIISSDETKLFIIDNDYEILSINSKTGVISKIFAFAWDIGKISDLVVDNKQIYVVSKMITIGSILSVYDLNYKLINHYTNKIKDIFKIAIHDDKIYSINRDLDTIYVLDTHFTYLYHWHLNTEHRNQHMMITVSKATQINIINGELYLFARDYCNGNIIRIFL